MPKKKRRVFLLRNSERQSYLRCRFRWNIAFNLKRTPKQPAPALRFGDLVHRSLEAYYIPGRKRGPHPAKTFTKLYKEQLKAGHRFTVKDEDEERTSVAELGPIMLEGYVDEYGPEKNIEIIRPEMPFEFDLHHPKTGNYVVTAVGKLDQVYLDHATGRYGIRDYKTAKSISTTHLALDEQAGTYWAVAPLFLRSIGLLEEDQTIEHILYDFLRKAKPDARPRNAKGQYLNKPTKKELKEFGKDYPGTPSKKQPAKLFHREKVYRDEEDRKQILWRIRTQAREMKKVRRGELVVYKNPTRDCSWDCPFFSICELHETGADWKEELQLSTVKWEPYSDHNRYNREEFVDHGQRHTED